MSGISTAKALHDSGYQNFLILEASPRVGGRIKDARVGNFTVELGAMWIYGKGSNPVYDMAKRFNITFTDSFTDNWTVRDEFGKNVTDAASLSYAGLEESVNKLARTVPGDVTVLAGLRNSDWRPRTSVDDVIEAYRVDFETGSPPSTLSAENLNLDETFEDFGNHEMMAVIHKSGFDEVVNSLRRSFMDEDDTRLVLNKRVNLIENSDNTVTVHTEDGMTYEADFVVVTFSLGVLQQREVTFSPPLPSRKQLAIDKFGICEFTHIYLQFPVTFWDTTMYILRASKIRGKFSVWQNMNIVYPGSNILQLSLFGEDVRWADKSTDEEVVNELHAALKALYPNSTVPYPSDYKISRWNTDPLTRGAFSYWPVGFTENNMKEMQAPFGRVFFAGEHLNDLHYGFVHGAYNSGQRTGSELIRCMDDPLLCFRKQDTTEMVLAM